MRQVHIYFTIFILEKGTKKKGNQIYDKVYTMTVTVLTTHVVSDAVVSNKYRNKNPNEKM